MHGPEWMILPNGLKVQLVRLDLPAWAGSPVEGHGLGAKALIDMGGRPMFAELAVLEQKRAQGWDGAWIDSYRRKYRVSMPPQTTIELPSEQAKLLADIRDRTGRWGGCWDVFAWRGSEFMFLELKRAHSSDRIRKTQVEFLEAALNLGVPIAAFSLVEWTIR